jgi:hypothetical protein
MTKETRRRVWRGKHAVHSATCSCTLELYDNKRSCFLRIFSNTEIFRGVFSIYCIINFAGRNSEVALGGAGVGVIDFLKGAVQRI